MNRKSGWLGWLAGLAHPWRSRSRRQLRLCESLALGERRFLSVVQLGRQKLLLGGTGTSLAVLAVLPDATSPAGETPDEESLQWKFVSGLQANE